MSIGIVIICRNEAAAIRNCLASVAGWADEIVVIDAESTDATVAICREFTDKIWVRPWEGFSEQRNFALQMAGSQWLFVLDADEIVSPELAAEVRVAVADQAGRSNPFTAFRIPRESWFCGKFMRWGGNYPDHVLRLFARGTATYSDRRVHESLVTSGPVGTLTQPLQHYTYPTVDPYFVKLRQYSRLAAEQLRRDGKKWRLEKMLISPIIAFLSRFVLKQGFRDGMQGFLYAALSGFSVFCKYAWLWDLTRQDADEARRGDSGDVT